ncbi:hypothetical protein ACN47E_000839 [Coniothyrium glycines]
MAPRRPSIGPELTDRGNPHPEITLPTRGRSLSRLDVGKMPVELPWCVVGRVGAIGVNPAHQQCEAIPNMTVISAHGTTTCLHPDGRCQVESSGHAVRRRTQLRMRGSMQSGRLRGSLRVRLWHPLLRVTTSKDIWREPTSLEATSGYKCQSSLSVSAI